MTKKTGKIITVPIPANYNDLLICNPIKNSALEIAISVQRKYDKDVKEASKFFDVMTTTYQDLGVQKIFGTQICLDVKEKIDEARNLFLDLIVQN